MPGPIDPLDMASSVRDVGRYIRDQRRQAELSLRKLANQAGVSNPYLSQIERGLRRPSAVILKDIAHALRISAETLYVRAGILDESADAETLESAIAAEPNLSDRQKQVLLDIYHSFLVEAKPAAPAAAAPKADSTTSRAGEPMAAAPTRRPRQPRAQRVEVTTPGGPPSGGTRTRSGASGPAAVGNAPKPRTSSPKRRRATAGTEGTAGGTGAAGSGTAQGAGTRADAGGTPRGDAQPPDEPRGDAQPGTERADTAGKPGEPASNGMGEAGSAED